MHKIQQDFVWTRGGMVRRLLCKPREAADQRDATARRLPGEPHVPHTKLSIIRYRRALDNVVEDDAIVLQLGARNLWKQKSFL